MTPSRGISSRERRNLELRDRTYISLWVKYTMFAFNFLFWIVGGIMVAIGFWAFWDKYTTYGEIRVKTAFDVILDLSIVLMIVGAVVFIISFAGCVGALRENTCLLKFYSICLTVIFLAELAIAITAFVFPNKIQELINKELSRELIEKYRDDDNLRNLIDEFQKQYQCCGVSDEGYKDWSHNIYFNCSPENLSSERCAVPYSCCKNPTNIVNNLVNVMCGFNTQNKPVTEAGKLIYTEGCITTMFESAKRNLYVIAGISLGIGFAQLFVLHLAKTLCDQISMQKAMWI